MTSEAKTKRNRKVYEKTTAIVKSINDITRTTTEEMR